MIYRLNRIKGTSTEIVKINKLLLIISFKPLEAPLHCIVGVPSHKTSLERKNYVIDR